MPYELRKQFARRIIWDYSSGNVEQWRHEGAERVLHVPLGYDAVLGHLHGDVDAATGEPSCDVLFYGSLSERRAHIIDALTAAGLRVQVMFGAYGAPRDDAIRAAKVVLNVHQNDVGVLELPRLAYLWSNAVPTVWEHGPLTEDPIGIGRRRSAVPYEALVGTCLEFVADPQLRAAEAVSSRAAFLELPHQDEILMVALQRSAELSREAVDA